MRQQQQALANIILILICGATIGHLVFRWQMSRPQLVVNPPVQCVDRMDTSAHYLASVAAAVMIKSHGPLPGESASAARAISEEAKSSGYEWPGDFKINDLGQICDCNGQPFQILVSRDRVTVTSPFLYSFYFAPRTSQ
jgi:hypothetical protein